MKREIFKYTLVLLLHVLMCGNVIGQERELDWRLTTETGISNSAKVTRNNHPDAYRLYNMNFDRLRSNLTGLPKRTVQLKNASRIMSFPDSEGRMERFEVFEASILADNLQKKHASIRSYIGTGVDNPKLRIRFSITKKGFHGMIFNGENGTHYIDTYTKDRNSYLVYSKRGMKSEDEFVCRVSEINDDLNNKTETNFSEKETNANDGMLRTFRLALATTGEYAQFHYSDQGVSEEASDEDKKAAVLSAIVVAMTRVNAIFERDLGITMELIENNELIIFLDPEGDNLSNSSGEDLIDEIQDKIDGEIGLDNYDIGHVFSTGGGGIAALRSPCTNSKAKGVTGLPSPIGDPFYIDYVCHEMGHQFGATHTYNTEDPDCSDQKNNSTAVEPGSGSTIMSYAGLCPPDNVQSNSDAYFHLVSIQQMWDNIIDGNSTCAVITDTGNNEPELEPLQNYTIPVSTPFFLEGVATDIDGDDLSYTWEQLDTELAAYPLVATSTEGPAFRSVSPSSSPRRYFPEINTILTGDLLNDWEVLPSVERSMRFGLTVRDNNPTVGQTTSAETLISFDDSAGPFMVTSHTEAETWDSGTVQTIEWNVANTNSEPVNCSFVDILLSTDGGQTFTVLLASNVENDGSQNIIVPNTTVEAARIMVVASNNIFFALNAADITIQSSEFVMDFSSNMVDVCLPDNAVFNFTYRVYLGFDEETTFSATGVPENSTVSFNPATAVTDGTTVEMTISNLDVASLGVHDISITGTSTSTTKNTAAVLGVYDSNISSPTLVFPENMATHILTPYVLRWDSGNNEQQYTVQISETSNFDVVLEEATILTAFFAPKNLAFNTDYFWRVKGENLCGTSAYSEVFKFSTANEVCNEFESLESPLNIPDAEVLGVKSVLNITKNQRITDINVKVNVTHPWAEDITMILISPKGKSVILASQNGGNGDNFENTIFDNESESPIVNGIAPFNGNYSPLGDLSSLNGEESYGSWILKLVDAGPEDIGKLESWSLEICGVDILGDDDDKDGVTNDIDLCENTPLNSIVDANGCSEYTLSDTNFSIEFTGETCTGLNDASLRIVSEETGTFYAIINETKHDFVKTLTLNNLAPGQISFCVRVYGEPLERCFNLDIPGAVGVKGNAIVSNENVFIEIEEGTAPFAVYLNNRFVLETSLESFEIPAKHGDLLEVKTAKTCEGVFQKSILLDNQVLLFPNPTYGPLELVVNLEVEEMELQFYSIQGQLVAVKSCQIRNGVALLDISELATGLYIVKSPIEGFESLKILKE